MNNHVSGTICSLASFSLLAFALPAATAGTEEISGLKATPSTNKVQKLAPYERTPDFLANLDAQFVNAWRPEQMPLRVYFTPPGADLDCFSNDMFVQFREACDDWTAVSKNRITFTYTEKKSDADIVVKFSADRRTATDSKEAGNAQLTPNSEGIASAKIELYTRDSHGQGYGAGSVFKGVCLHEIGHALGISGHSRNTRDIMAPILPIYPNTPHDQVKLTQRDINTLDRIYSDPDSLYARRRARAIAAAPHSTAESPQELSRDPRVGQSKEVAIDDCADQAVYLFATKRKAEACAMLQKAIMLAQQSRKYPREKLMRMREQLFTYQKHSH